MSVWHSPDASIRTTTWPRPGSGTGRSSMTSGWPKPGTTAARMGTPFRSSADDQDRAVGEMDDLVRRAAQDQAGQVTPAARAHHDDVDAVLDRVVDDLPPGVAEQGVPDLAVRVHAGRG